MNEFLDACTTRYSNNNWDKWKDVYDSEEEEEAAPAAEQGMSIGGKDITSFEDLMSSTNELKTKRSVFALTRVHTRDSWASNTR